MNASRLRDTLQEAVFRSGCNGRATDESLDLLLPIFLRDLRRNRKTASLRPHASGVFAPLSITRAMPE